MALPTPRAVLSHGWDSSMPPSEGQVGEVCRVTLLLTFQQSMTASLDDPKEKETGTAES